MAGQDRQDSAGSAHLNPQTIVEGPGFRIRFSNEDGYLRAHVFDGSDSQQVSIAMWTLLGEQCRLTGASRLLVLEELQETVEVGEIVPIIDAMQNSGLATVRVAFVELQDDIAGSEYGEILCLERGMTVHSFSDEGDARRWLLYGN
jgi:hypothetical protein